MTISSFNDEYFFLSNFYPSPLSIPAWDGVGGIVYPTAEHAYQAAKCAVPEQRHQVAALPTPGKAKRFGRSVKLPQYWDNHRYGIMEVVIMHKFPAGTELAEKLKATNGHTLIEGNTWHDNYWGNCICAKCENIPGQNVLGNILANRRYHLLPGNG